MGPFNWLYQRPLQIGCTNLKKIFRHVKIKFDTIVKLEKFLFI